MKRGWRGNGGSWALTMLVAGCATTAPRYAMPPGEPVADVPTVEAEVVAPAVTEPTAERRGGVLDVGPRALRAFEPVVARDAPVVEVGPWRGRRHVVRPGETLFGIARDHLGTGGRWREIAEANPQITGDQLAAGDVLLLP